MFREELTVNLARPWRARNGHMVAPAVLMTEGVHCGSRGCLLHRGEILRDSVAAWTDVPVTLNHPTVDGTPVSVRSSQQVFDRYVIGYVESPKYDQLSHALKADIVIATTNPAIRRKIERTKEVSVGIFTEDYAQQGRFYGKQYEAIATSHVPDHLALLPDGTGACSWTDGCGIRTNADDYAVVAMQRAFSAYTIEDWKDELFGKRKYADEPPLGRPGVEERDEQDTFEREFDKGEVPPLGRPGVDYIKKE